MIKHYIQLPQPSRGWRENTSLIREGGLFKKKECYRCENKSVWMCQRQFLRHL